MFQVNFELNNLTIFYRVPKIFFIFLFCKNYEHIELQKLHRFAWKRNQIPWAGTSQHVNDDQKYREGFESGNQ